MAKPQRTIPADMLANRQRAQNRLQRRWCGCSTTKIAVAPLTSGVVHQYADPRRGFETVERYRLSPHQPNLEYRLLSFT
jgi:hypothetical protein